MIHIPKPVAYFTHANHDKFDSLRSKSALLSSFSRTVCHWFDSIALIKVRHNGTQTKLGMNG